MNIFNILYNILDTFMYKTPYFTNMYKCYLLTHVNTLLFCGSLPIFSEAKLRSMLFIDALLNYIG